MAITKERKKAVKPAESVRQAKMTKEDMEMAAYFHWLGRGCPGDDALTDWIEVEKKWGQESVSTRMDAKA